MIKIIVKFLLLSALLYAFFHYFGDFGFIQIDEENIYRSIAIFMGVLVGLNMVLKPVLKFLSIPLTCLTMGLFSFVINFIIVYLADYLVHEVQFRDLMVTFGFSLAFAFAYSVVEYIVGAIFD